MMTMPMIQDKAFHGDIEKKASDATIFRAGRLSHSRQCLADRFCWASVHLAQAFVTLAYASKSSSLQPGCQRIVQRQQWHLKLDSATHEPAVQVTVTSNEISKKQLATYVPRGSTAKYVPPQLRNVDASCRPDNQALQQEEGRTSSGAKGKYVPPHLRMVDANACLSSQVVQKEGSSFQRTLSDMSIASTDCGTSVISDDATSCFSPSDGCPGLVRFSADIEVHYVEALSRQAQWGCEEEGTSWLHYASRRQERFRVRTHGQRVCSNAGCSCDHRGLCSVGGQLATEVDISAAEAFSAWRRIACIPATVPNHRLKHGLTWHTRRPKPSSQALPHLASSQAWPQLNLARVRARASARKCGTSVY